MFYDFILWAIQNPTQFSMLLILMLYWGFPLYASLVRAWSNELTWEEKAWFVPYIPIILVLGLVDILVAILVASPTFKEKWTYNRATVSQMLCYHYVDTDYNAAPINRFLPGHIYYTGD